MRDHLRFQVPELAGFRRGPRTRVCFCSGARAVQLRDRLPEGLTPSVAGRALVARDLLRRRLGGPAFQVWQVLCALRAPDGTCHPTQRGIGNLKGFAPLAERTVEKALVRLRACGLVESVGWTPKTVRRGHREIMRKVFVRRVFGAMLKDALPTALNQCAVPHACVRWISNASEWGGFRSGAGMRRSNERNDRVLNRDRSRGADTTPDQNESSGGKGTSQGAESSGGNVASSGGDVEGVGAESSGGADSLILNTRESNGQLSPNGESAPSLRDAVLSLSGRSGVVQLETRSGTFLGGGAARARHPLSLIQSFPAPCPPWPRFDFAQVPPPPLLPEHLDADELAFALGRAYRGAAESRTGQRCFILSSGLPQRWKAYPVLVAGARVMQELEIAPAAWAAWSWDLWLEQLAQGGTPSKAPRGRTRRPKAGPRPRLAPVTWVFGPKRIRERWRWFRSEERQYEGGRCIYGVLQQAFQAKYQRMRWAVVRNGYTLESAAQEFFPGDTYEREVAAVKAEIAENRGRLVRQAQEGMFLW